MTDPFSSTPQYGPVSLSLLQQAPPPTTPMWAPPPTTPPLILSPVNTAQTTPVALLPFSPTTGPTVTQSKCPYADNKDSQPAKQPEKKSPKKPCDVASLSIQVKEPNATDKAAEPVLFNTAKVAKLPPSQRPRDLGADTLAPEPIHSLLASHDLVIEVVAPTSDKGTAKAKIGGANSDSRHDVLMAQSKAKASASGGVTTLIVGSTRDACCGDPTCAGTILTEKGQPPALMGASFSKPIKSKSKSDIGNLWDFVTSGLNPRVLGREYTVLADTCGVLSKGVPTDSLSAVVIAYPPGVTGIKVGFEGTTFGLGWSGTKADKYAKEYTKKNQSILDGTTSGRLEDKIDRELENGARLAESRPKGGKKVQEKHKTKLKTSRQEIARLQHLLDAKQDADSWPLSVGIVLFDEEIDVQETLKKVKKVFDTIERAKSTVDGLLKVIKFVTEYSPSLITPVAELSFSFFQLELFVGFKLTSDDRCKGDRWRGLPRCFDIEFNCKAVEVTGTFGAIIGKRICGTGASIEVLFTPTIGISFGAEYSSPPSLVSWSEKWENTKLKAQGDFRGTASLSGKVSIFYFNLAYASVDANASGRASTDSKVAEVISGKAKLVMTLTLDPGGGSVEAYVIGFKKPWRYDYEMWEGGVKDVTL